MVFTPEILLRSMTDCGDPMCNRSTWSNDNRRWNGEYDPAVLLWVPLTVFVAAARTAELCTLGAALVLERIYRRSNAN
jgi:hypothetical protein